MKSTAIEKFIGNIERLLEGETFDLYDSSIDASFEYICAAILISHLEPGVWFDGTGDLEFKIASSSQLVFTGNMHVCLNQEKFWKEPFYARVWDRRVEGKGVPILVRIGKNEDEQDLLKIEW